MRKRSFALWGLILTTGLVVGTALPAGAQTVTNFARGGGRVPTIGITRFSVGVQGTPQDAIGRFSFTLSGQTHTVEADCIVVTGNQAWVAGPRDEPNVPPNSRFELVLLDNAAIGQPDRMNTVSFLGVPHSCPTFTVQLFPVEGNVSVGTRVTPP